MRWFFNLLLGPAFIDRWQKGDDIWVFVFEVIAERLHIKWRGLISVYKYNELFFVIIHLGREKRFYLMFFNFQASLMYLKGINK